MFEDNPVTRLLEVAKEPYSTTNVLIAYRTIHEILGFEFINTVDFSEFGGELDSCIKDPIHLVVDICMGNIGGLILAAYEYATRDGKAKKYDLDLGSFFDSVIDLCSIAVMSAYDGPGSVKFTGVLPPTADAKLKGRDRDVCLAFVNEVNVLITLGSYMLSVLYSDKVAEDFEKFVIKWSERLSDVFTTTMTTKSLQGG